LPALMISQLLAFGFPLLLNSCWPYLLSKNEERILFSY